MWSFDFASGHATMNLKTSDGVEIGSPSRAQVERAFAALHEPGDFLVLDDPNRGQLRFAGSAKGPFLAQCDLVLPQSFAGERNNVPLSEATTLAAAFLAGDSSWTTTFRNTASPSNPIVAVVLIVAAGLALAAWFILWP
jgi:hypothetical protein